jgi:CTP synthase (UTP-ammonia lyase)
MPGAEHEETAPDGSTLLISKLTCSLVGQIQAIRLVPGSIAWQAYGQDEVMERFQCNYGLNPGFRSRFTAGGLAVTGADLEGEARVVELADHPFYLATLFLPQLTSTAQKPHPLIAAYLQAARAMR